MVIGSVYKQQCYEKLFTKKGLLIDSRSKLKKKKKFVNLLKCLIVDNVTMYVCTG